MCKEGQKTLSYGYKKIPIEELEQLQNNYDEESNEFRDELLTNMIYLCTFGIEDPIRESVLDSINLIARQRDGSKSSGGINIRMISGDHLFTCLSVAKSVGIISE